MAHNLEINNGVASYVENGKKERAWHGLGQVFDGPIMVEEALKLSHADYTVEKQPIVALTPEIIEALGGNDMVHLNDLISQSIIEGKMATIRTDKQRVLGVVSDSYGVVQNAEAFKFIDVLCSGELGNHAPVIETAGVLGKGERIFITAKFSEQIILDNKSDDRVEMYVVFTTSHDGTGAVNCMVTPTRVVCNNTLNMAFKNHQGKISLRHSANIMQRLDLSSRENAEFAYRTLNMMDVYKKSLEESLFHLRNIRLSDKDVENLFAKVMLSDANFKTFQETRNLYHDDIATKGRNLMLGAIEALHCGVGQEYGEKGTGLWALNGLTTYFQNQHSYKNEEAKFISIQQGRVADKLQKAYDFLVA